MRPFLSVIVVLGCLAPAPAQANPYAEYVAEYLGEYMLGKALDEAWDAATGAPDIKELDLRLRAFEGALSQVDASLCNRIGELRRRTDQRPTPDELRQIVLQVVGDLDARVAALVAWERGLQAKGTVVDAGLASDIKMVLIQPGKFVMGWHDADDIENHAVKITKAFCLSATEVTQGQYERVMGTNPSHFKGDPRRPVENVSWEEAVEFCRRLSTQEGRTYRLPTEAEWEYACRADGKTKWSFGDDESALDEHAWYAGNSGNTTHPVGEKKPNAWGLYDMHGNVGEWCSDGYGTCASTPVSDPSSATAGSIRVSRGGSWDSEPCYCQSAYRYYVTPGSRFVTLGFRVASSSVDASGK